MHAAPFGNEEALHRIVDASQTTRNYPGVFEQTRWSTRCVKGTFNLMKDILSAYYEYNLSPTSHKSKCLRTGIHTGTFVLLGHVEIVPKIFPHFSVTL